MYLSSGILIYCLPTNVFPYYSKGISERTSLRTNIALLKPTKFAYKIHLICQPSNSVKKKLFFVSPRWLLMIIAFSPKCSKNICLITSRILLSFSRHDKGFRFYPMYKSLYFYSHFCESNCLIKISILNIRVMLIYMSI